MVAGGLLGKHLPGNFSLSLSGRCRVYILASTHFPSFPAFSYNVLFMGICTDHGPFYAVSLEHSGKQVQS